jgi:hypothetical protein
MILIGHLDPWPGQDGGSFEHRWSIRRIPLADSGHQPEDSCISFRRELEVDNKLALISPNEIYVM